MRRSETIRCELALIHGWGIGKHVWSPLQEHLSPFCRLHLVDLPGYGESPAWEADFSSAALALLDRLPQPAVLCAWSLGAMLALRAASLAPQRVAGLLLVAATPSFVQRDQWSAGQPGGLVEELAERLASSPEETLQRFAVLMNQGDTQARAVARWVRTCLQQQPAIAPQVLRQGLQWLTTVDLRALASTIGVRSLLVHGANDRLTPLAAAAWLAEAMPDCRLETFIGAAHAPFLADVQRFVDLARDFCSPRIAS